MASWVSVSLVMRSSFGFSRQPALSPRQPRGGSEGERWRGGGQPQGCRSHHEQCLLCAHSPALCAALMPNSLEAESVRRCAFAWNSGHCGRAGSPFELVSRGEQFDRAEKSDLGVEKGRSEQGKAGSGHRQRRRCLSTKTLILRVQLRESRERRFH